MNNSNNYHCIYCGDEYPSLTSVMRHEVLCVKEGDNKEPFAAYHHDKKKQQQPPSVAAATTKTNQPWWKAPLTNDNTANNGKKSLPAATGVAYQRHSHHNWVKIGEKYQVLAMSSDKMNGVESEVDYQVVLTQSYLYNGSILTNFESEVNRGRKSERMIYVVWPDMGIIPLEDYNRLLGFLERLLRAKKRLAIGCLGGHGRTGTILAGLIQRIEKRTAADAIKTLRERYCKSAVETVAQEGLVTGQEVSRGSDHSKHHTIKMPKAGDANHSSYGYYGGAYSNND
ncbi:hypothetical protein HYS50_03420 [Candidatus Woesearchaeota archaeon]|nr:hypothetical protein [Candidatus Woesearchaeota archaeon]